MVQLAQQQRSIETDLSPGNERLPNTTGLEVKVDEAKLQEMTEFVEKRSTAVAVIPGKGTMVMTKNQEGNYEMTLKGIDGTQGEYTIDARGKLLKVGETDVQKLSPYHELKINMLNEFLQALPAEQIKVNIIPSRVPDFQLQSGDVLAEKTQNGHFDKTELIVSIWARTGGTPERLRAAVEETKYLIKL